MAYLLFVIAVSLFPDLMTAIVSASGWPLSFALGDISSLTVSGLGLGFLSQFLIWYGLGAIFAVIWLSVGHHLNGLKQ